MKEYQTVTRVTGPLIVVKSVENVGYNDIVKIATPSGDERLGQVLELNRDAAVVEVFEGTRGIDAHKTRVRFTGEAFRLGVSEDMLGGVFDGLGRPMTVRIIPEKEMDINGKPINPGSRELPREFIQTGFSAIDGLLSLVKGQKLPIFSESGLDHNMLAARLAEQVEDSIVVVFGAIGLTSEEVRFFINEFRKAGSMESMVVFANQADDPVIERVITPRAALAAAEYFAWDKGRDVLVILSDMTNYANALREISAAKEEVPSRRGYPPYLYTDLATIYERTGRIRGRKGSITQMPILTMPEGDITHPIPDLTGYITEGQILLSRDLARLGVFPSINIIPSLSRMMHHGVGKGFTREDHAQVSDQVYAAYAKAKKLEALKAVIGEEALTATDKKYVEFGRRLEEEFISQKEARSVKKTLDTAWKLLGTLPRDEMTKIDEALVKKYWQEESKK